MSQFITFMGDDLINALGWTFVHTLWQGCVIVLLMIFVLQQIPAKKAILRYTVATASMISMIVAAVATFAMLYFQPGHSEALVTNGGIHVAGPEAGAGFSFVGWLSGNLSAMVAIWVAGVVLLACRLIFGLAYIQYLKQTASDLSFKLGGRLAAIAKKINYQRPLDVAESALVQIPVVVGHIKPLILFPVGAINQLTTEEVEAVLAHEIAHLVRNDFIQNLIQSVIEIVFYYHPAVWWISAVVRSERENCCDDLAIQVCGSSLTYARALVRLQEVGQSAPALALPFTGSKNHLLNRVKRILNEPQNKSNLMEKITATSLLLLCLIFASFSDGNTEKEVPRETIDVPALLVSNHYLHFEKSFVGDTIIPRSSTTIVRGDSDGKEVRLEYENGEIKGLYINGEEVPESQYDEYAEEITVLEQSMSNVPAPPAPPGIAEMPPMPAMPAMPPMPAMPDMPAMPPMPPMPAMPDMPPMPAMPATPPLPDMHGMIFEYSNGDEYAPLVAHIEPVITRTESTIIREYDDNGNATYRVVGDHADDTTIEIDQEAGVAFIDGKEIVIDADEITVIEEIETTPANVFAYSTGNVGSWDSKEWNEKFNKDFNKQMNDKWNSEEFQKQWKENWDQEKWNKQWKENWNKGEWEKYAKENKAEWEKACKEMKIKMEDCEDGGSGMKFFKKKGDGYGYEIIELNGDVQGQNEAIAVYIQEMENGSIDSLRIDQDNLLRTYDLVLKESQDQNMSDEQIARLKREYQEAYEAGSSDAKMQYRVLRETNVKRSDVEKRELEKRELRKIKESKKDHSLIDDSSDARFFTYSTNSNSGQATVVDIVADDGSKMIFTSDTIHYDSDSDVITLTGNAVLNVGEVRSLEGDKIEFVLSPEGEDGIKGYTVLVSSDAIDAADDGDNAGKLMKYEVKVVKDPVLVEGTKAKVGKTKNQ